MTGNNPTSLNQFVKRLNNMFALKDMGDLHHFLGIKVKRDATGMYLTQASYIENLLKKTDMVNTRPCPTLAIVGNKFVIFDGDPLDNPTHYRSIIGALQYLKNTRPDIAFIVNKLTQFLQAPTTTHWQGLKRVMRYLKGTKDLGLHIRYCEHLSLQGFSDADYANKRDDRPSTVGYCVFLGDSLVTWSSKKQNVVFRSSAES
ncbi:hypothetical protein UlMin_030730 [Ulmus minor]